MPRAVKFVQKMVFMSSRPIVLAQDITDWPCRLVFDAGDYVDDLLTSVRLTLPPKTLAICPLS